MTRRPSRNWPGGSTRRYRAIREFVLRRDGWLCQLNHPRCTQEATTVHHLDSRADYGDDPARMVAACVSCNNKEGSPDNARDPRPRPVTRW